MRFVCTVQQARRANRQCLTGGVGTYGGNFARGCELFGQEGGGSVAQPVERGVATQIFKGQENDAFPYRGLRRAPASGPESEYGAAKAESDREAFQRTLGSIAMSA